LVLRQPQIQKREIELAMREQVQCLGPIGSLDYSVVHAFQGNAQRPPYTGFVVDDQNVHCLLVKEITVHFAWFFVQIASAGNTAFANFKPEQSAPPPFAFWNTGRHGDCVQWVVLVLYVRAQRGTTCES